MYFLQKKDLKERTINDLFGWNRKILISVEPKPPSLVKFSGRSWQSTWIKAGTVELWSICYTEQLMIRAIWRWMVCRRWSFVKINTPWKHIHSAMYTRLGSIRNHSSQVIKPKRLCCGCCHRWCRPMPWCMQRKTPIPFRTWMVESPM